jgi:hypothetical protein
MWTLGNAGMGALQVSDLSFFVEKYMLISGCLDYLFEFIY